jgi:hypothetical protein
MRSRSVLDFRENQRRFLHHITVAENSIMSISQVSPNVFEFVRRIINRTTNPGRA